MSTPLTPAEIESLQGRELDAAVAEWMGWERVTEQWFDEEGLDVEVLIGPNGERHAIGWESRYDEAPPYSADHTAISEVENEIERRGLTEPYIEALSEIVAAPFRVTVYNDSVEIDNQHIYGIDGHNFLWRMVHATPEQRARAVLAMWTQADDERLTHEMSDHSRGPVGNGKE